MNKQHVLNILQAIADGYPYRVHDDEHGFYIIVGNPKYSPDNGEDPLLLISIEREERL